MWSEWISIFLSYTDLQSLVTNRSKKILVKNNPDQTLGYCAGLYLRRLVLSFNCLSFHEVSHLLANFRAYHSSGKEALARIPDTGVPPTATTGEMHGKETSGGVQGVDRGVPETPSLMEDSAEVMESNKLDVGKGVACNGEGVAAAEAAKDEVYSKRQAELYIAKQVADFYHFIRENKPIITYDVNVQCICNCSQSCIITSLGRKQEKHELSGKCCLLH